MASLHHLVDGTGPAVVLLHAGVADLRMWDPQVAVLVPGRRVVRCDLPGYGGTPVGPTADGSGADGSDADGSDAERVLNLLDGLDVDRFSLVGASLGGHVALQVATAAPERVERLVLIDAAADLVEPDPSLREVWRREERLLEHGDVDGATELMVDTFLGPDADDGARRLLRTMQRRAYELQGEAPETEDHDLPVDLTRITAPTTVVVGAHDLPFFHATASALASGLPDADLLELTWAGHLPSLERPTETAQLVAAALDRR